MPGAINLNHQRHFMAVEIQDVGTGRMLPSKPITLEATVTQVGPKNDLHGSLLTSQLLRDLRKALLFNSQTPLQSHPRDPSP